MSKIALSGNASGTGTFTIASPNSNTDRTVNLPDAGGDMVLTDATQTLTNKSIVATQLTGTVPAARLGSGTADTTTFLRGDNTWQTISTTPTTDQVLLATAGAAVGAVGTYAWLRPNNTTAYAPGATLAGSTLRYQSAPILTDATTRSSTDGAAPSGTWRCMGNRSASISDWATLWLRIS